MTPSIYDLELKQEPTIYTRMGSGERLLQWPCCVFGCVNSHMVNSTEMIPDQLPGDQMKIIEELSPIYMADAKRNQGA